MQNRDFNEAYARGSGRFWLPCPGCGEFFGGHEWLDIKGFQSSIPDPGQTVDDYYNGNGISARGICPDCTMSGVGNRSWEEFWKNEISTSE